MANKISKLDVSALVLTRNDAPMLEGCLQQLDFVKEIIVLDQQSTDNTVEVAAKFTDILIKTANSNFAQNRNELAKKAKSKWLLYLDTDERVTEKNVVEIKEAIGNAQFQAYYFPRKNIVLGKWLKHGGWWPDYVPRLFEKQNLQRWYGAVHESPEVKGNYGYFKNPIAHYTARSMDQMLHKSVVWAQVEARLFFEANFPKVNIFRVIKASVREFIRRYFVKMGVLDGTVGLIEAVYQSLHQAMVLVYLWEMQNKTKERFEKITND